jgi:hypothetical protein
MMKIFNFDLVKKLLYFRMEVVFIFQLEDYIPSPFQTESSDLCILRER